MALTGQRSRPALGSPASVLAGHRILLDCRWLGMGGAGRATELLLRSLAELQPPGDWLLWAAPQTPPCTWPGAKLVEGRHSPKALLGQREAFAAPAHDLAVYPHQYRPLRPGASVTLIHDTIPLRLNGTPPGRALKRLFLRLVARRSTHLLTVSAFSRDCLVRDLGVSPDKVTVLRYPADLAMAARVRALRGQVTPRAAVLFVGRFSPHKNLPRLLAAFPRTAFARRGGELLLVGGAPAEVDVFRSLVARRGLRGVQIAGVVPQPALERLYASVRALVLPSLEEGFGLPAWEALACGLPLCVSDGGALPEVVQGAATPFAARSPTALVAALDRAVAEPVGAPAPPHVLARTCNDLGKQLVRVLAGADW